jgi:peptidoglycan/LPS O-acetylase OafA/YrhL
MDKNNFDGVRLGLALIVFFAHIGILTEASEFSTFKYLFDSVFAVKGFFAISGFLIGRSYLSSGGLADYAEKRIRRIFPAYMSTILLCLLIGGVTTSLSVRDFLTAPDTIRYIFANVSLANFLQPTLPGVFEGNPAQYMNGSLWTIKIELMLYFCTPILILLFRRYGALMISPMVFFSSIAWAWYFEYDYPGRWGDEIARQFPGQLSYFVVGLLFSFDLRILVWLKYIALVSVVSLFVFDNWMIKLFLDPISYSTGVLYLSILAIRNLGIGRFGDISYGIYLYHYPIIQFLIFCDIFQRNVWLGLVVALFSTVLISFASWHLLEKKWLLRGSRENTKV